MKKNLLIVLVFMSTVVVSQEAFYQKIKESITQQYPTLKLENKLIVINTWAESDIDSRKMNAGVDKAYATYEYAKLKGGTKGMIGVIVCRDQNNNIGIALNRDKIGKAISLKNISPEDLAGFSNVIFDSKGEIVKKNIAGDIFEEIHTLITR